MNKSIYLLLGLSLVQACSTGAEKKLNEDMKQVPETATITEVRMSAETMLQNSKDLSEEERSSLMALMQKSRKEQDLNREEGLKLRMVLIKAMGRNDYDAKEVSLIKKKMKKNNKENLELTFKAIEEANKILGRQTAETRGRLMNSFYTEHLGNK